MNNKQQQLAQKLARLDTLESQRRSMLEEYMPIKNEIEILKDEVEELETQLLSEDQVEDDKRFDEIIDSLHNQALKDAGIEIVEVEQYDDGVNTIEENEAIEMEQLIDEIKNPEDDLKDLESSIV
jgi:chromosome segregation ATPase